MNKDLIERLNRAIANKGLSISQISEELEIERSIFNKFVNGQRVPNIEVLLKIIDYLFKLPSERYDFLRSLVPNFKSIQPLKVILEIARLNRDEETVLQAATIISNATQKKDKEWADFYLLWQKLNNGQINNDTYLETLLSYPIQSEELQAFRKLTLSHYYITFTNQLEIAVDYCQKAKSLIDSLPTSLIKNSYLARYYGYMAMLLRKYNQLDESLSYLEEANKYALSDLMRGIHLYKIAQTYQFFDHRRARVYLKETEFILREFGEYDPSLIGFADYIINRIIPYNSLVSNDLEGIKEENLTYPECQIMYHVRSGNDEKARALLDSLDENQQNEDVFLLCRGILEKSIPILLKSLAKYIEKFEINEAEPAIHELRKLNCDPVIIDSMLSARLGKSIPAINT